MPAPITCAVCGEIGWVKPYKAATAKYCSHDCRLKALHEKLKNDRPKAEHVCIQCGSKFKRSPSSGSNRYCSRACYDIAQRNSAADVFARVDQSDGPNACWPWQGPVTVWGYGSATRNRRGHNAHRLAYIAVNGEIPREVVVMHKCDNRLCCNPAHLEAGTQKQNIADMDAKGRRGKRKHS
jgi:hypothetical protein